MSEFTVFGLELAELSQPVRVITKEDWLKKAEPQGAAALVCLADGCWQVQGWPQPVPLLPADASLAQLLSMAEEVGGGVLLADKQGQPARFFRSTQVATALANQVEQLTAALDTLLNTVNETVCAIDSQGAVTMWNESAVRRYGIEGSAILGRDIREFFSNLIITQVRDNVLSSGREVRDQYHQPVAGVHVLINAAPISGGGQVLGALTAERDITETMRLSMELARSNKRLDHLQREVDEYNKQSSNPFSTLHQGGAAMTALADTARRVAKGDVGVLLRGEPGSGRSEFARAIHQAGSRRERPFVSVECAHLSAQRLDDALDQAEQGTLYLYGVEALPRELQRRLTDSLRYEAREVRFLSATAADLEALIAQQAFDQALYYHINVVTLTLPPLRERRDELSAILHEQLRQVCLRQALPVPRLEAETEACLLNYRWPGNFPELRNVLERLVALSSGDSIPSSLLPASLRRDEANSFRVVLPDVRDQAEREMIRQALIRSGGDRSRAARLLGIPRSTLYYKLNKYDLHNGD